FLKNDRDGCDHTKGGFSIYELFLPSYRIRRKNGTLVSVINIIGLVITITIGLYLIGVHWYWPRIDNDQECIHMLRMNDSEIFGLLFVYILFTWYSTQTPSRLANYFRIVGMLYLVPSLSVMTQYEENRLSLTEIVSIAQGLLKITAIVTAYLNELQAIYESQRQVLREYQQYLNEIQEQFQIFKTSPINEESICIKMMGIISSEDKKSIEKIFKISISLGDLLKKPPQPEIMKIKIMYDVIKDYDRSNVKLLVFIEDRDISHIPIGEQYLESHDQFKASLCSESTFKAAAASLASNLEEEIKYDKFSIVKFLRSYTSNFKDTMYPSAVIGLTAAVYILMIIRDTALPEVHRTIFQPGLVAYGCTFLSLRLIISFWKSRIESNMALKFHKKYVQKIKRKMKPPSSNQREKV
ncbi:uncharacterized protein TRIADDRAFT_62907, partial [Trichoplax adhaerens]